MHEYKSDASDAKRIATPENEPRSHSTSMAVSANSEVASRYRSAGKPQGEIKEF